jgi:hypothetical protein
VPRRKCAPSVTPGERAARAAVADEREVRERRARARPVERVEAELVVVRLDALVRRDARRVADLVGEQAHDHELRLAAEAHLPVVAVVAAVGRDHVLDLRDAAEELDAVVGAAVRLDVVDHRPAARRRRT